MNEITKGDAALQRKQVLQFDITLRPCLVSDLCSSGIHIFINMKFDCTEMHLVHLYQVRFLNRSW